MRSFWRVFAQGDQRRQVPLLHSRHVILPGFNKKSDFIFEHTEKSAKLIQTPFD
jgi:hypothetical protein